MHQSRATEIRIIIFNAPCAARNLSVGILKAKCGYREEVCGELRCHFYLFACYMAAGVSCCFGSVS